ncbi:hypothetical protein VTK73DRAFT_2591 [Phialemonium thermophilum]|uniref:Major facilitator superfamily (MFS) profile domain-containing protein n=1 Tax=Phialemonium thermophilum TaxID=223376 RepID=A0ABR3VRX2_9PEZI
MIQSFGIPRDEVARWAGITGSVFSVSQSLTAVPWGRASDKFGRKPIILIGLTSTMICFIIWGLSSSLWMAITIRAVMGGGNGNVGIIRTMVAEMVPQRELQPKAFSIMPLVWSVGSVFGPAFGGFFARPAERYPSLFGHSKLFVKYPFLLPNLVACVVFFISLMAGLLFLKETLETKRHTKDWGLLLGEKLTRPFHRSKRRRQHRRSFLDDEAQAPLLAEGDLSSSQRRHAHHLPPPTAKEILTSQTVINLVCYTFLAFHSVAFDQVLPVFLHYPEQKPDEHNTKLPFKFSGGFGLGSNSIGTIFTIYGIACGIIQFFVFPPLCSRFGVLNCFKAAVLTFPVIYILIPYTALVQDVQMRYAFFIVLMLVKGCVVIVGFPCTTILLTNSAASLRVLGTLNGFATMFSGIGRALGPAMTGAVFTLGVQKGYVIFPWALLAFVSVLGAFPVWWIVEGPGPTPASDSEDDDNDDDDEDVAVEDGRAPNRTGEDDDDDDEDTLYNDGDDDADADNVLRARPVMHLLEPDDPASDSDTCPPPPPNAGVGAKTAATGLATVAAGKIGSPSASKTGSAAPPQVRLRRMSVTGHEVERDGRDAKRRAKDDGEDS